MNKVIALKLSGWLLILFAISSALSFHYLLEKFDYPDSLLKNELEIVQLLNTIDLKTRVVWILYSLLPITIIPVGILYYNSRLRNLRIGHLYKYIAHVSAICMSIGSLRWPIIHMSLNPRYMKLIEAGKSFEDSIFVKLNMYLGNIAGEIIGELAFGLFLIVTSLSLITVKKWASIIGIFISIFVLIGAFRSVSDLFDFGKIFYDNVGAIWMVLLGIGVIRSADIMNMPTRDSPV